MDPRNDTYFYQEPGSRVGDVIPKYIDGRFEIFYLKGYMGPAPEGAKHGWHHISASSVDRLGPSKPIGVMGGTGDLIRVNGTWHLFACIFPEGKQLVTHYVGIDDSLEHWEYVEEDTFGPDGRIYDLSDWRDPRILWDEAQGLYHMYLCAREKTDHARGGCVGHCVSKDLKHWNYLEPLYAPGRFCGACECPDVFREGDWEYLVFSAYTNLYGTYYVKRRVGSDIWQIPARRFDARAFYAAKTASDGEHRYLFGWNPTKEEDIFGYWPSNRKEKDLRTYDWGGSMVIHEITQDAEGNLWLQAPEEKLRLLGPREELSIPKKGIGYKKETVIPVEQESVTLWEDPGEAFELEVSFSAERSGEMGVLLKADPELKQFYSIVVEPERGRMQYKSHIRCTEEGGKTFPYDVELETFFPVPDDGKYHLQVIVERETGVAYINDKAALSFRMYDRKEGHVGAYIPSDGTILHAGLQRFIEK
ncbi:MAG: GH32 C-terminal domain-containing protein [Lachnospiraceae bacterium]|nr:GH32 C-terminal domain-containing protein [Lachnospiraceae bacterium]